MWTLILTLVSGLTGGPSSMTYVPGFESEDACMTAARAWLKQIPEPGRVIPRALCANTKARP